MKIGMIFGQVLAQHPEFSEKAIKLWVKAACGGGLIPISHVVPGLTRWSIWVWSRTGIEARICCQGRFRQQRYCGI